jgi:hypothetical protein
MHIRFLKLRLSRIAAAMLTLGLLLGSCSEGSEQGGGALSVKPDRADFGTIDAGDPVVFSNVLLKLTNRGEERIEVKDVQLPDGFTYSIAPRDTIPAGATATLKITFDRRNFPGPAKINATAMILTDDPDGPELPVNLAVEIVGEAGSGPAPRALEPDISFEHKTHNFGTITRKQMVEHVFPFRNDGKKTLKINYIETGCLCATATASATEIPPGGSAEIVIKLEAYKFPGDDPRKTLRVNTNDPDEPFVGLTISAQIIDAVVLEPREIILPNIQSATPATVEARITQDGFKELEIIKIDTSSPNISVEQFPLDGEEKGFLLKITIGPEMPEGKFEEIVTINTNYGNYKNKPKNKGPGLDLYRNYRKLQLPVKGSVGSAISIIPQSINFGSASPGDTLSRKLVVTSASPLEIQSVSIPDTAFRASFKLLDEGAGYEITLDFVPAAPQRRIEERLTIRTPEKELTVPVFATVRAAAGQTP